MKSDEFVKKMIWFELQSSENFITFSEQVYTQGNSFAYILNGCNTKLNI